MTTVLAVCGIACLLAPLAAMLPYSSRGFTNRPAGA
jgi:hypothetical protein